MTDLASSTPRSALGLAMRGIDAAIRLLDRIPLSVLTLLARVVIALVFWQSGQTKVEGFAVKDATFYLFAEEYRVPLIPPVLAAYMAVTLEHVGPILLVIGLGARFAALALLGMTLVIEIFVYPDAYVTHGLWAVALLLIIARGAGVFSLDDLIRRRYGAPVVPAKRHFVS